jgi:hypothetical protein
MRRKRYLRHGLWAVALGTVLVFSAQSSSADEWYPGLPDPEDGFSSQWSGAAGSGLSYAKRAKQWFRSPDAMSTASIQFRIPAHGQVEISARAYLVSPKGAPANYGYLAPMKVRSVGFGLMPVEATVQVSQRRENGYPIALKAELGATQYYEPFGNGGEAVAREVAAPTVVDDALNVQILEVLVDGVDLQLTGDCRTVTPAPVHLVGPGYTIAFPYSDGNADKFYRSADPSTYFNPYKGGQLTGTMTIPAFTGCTTASGDDLSALMTLSVSGPDNPISARAGWPCSRNEKGASAPLAPGQSTPKLTLNSGWTPGSESTDGCNGTKKLAYPPRADD